MITRLRIQNFKCFSSFSLDFNPDLNIVVGDNEAGKSTILEAIHLALIKKINGRAIEYELSSHLFNKDCSDAYLAAVRAGKNPPLPEIIIELYLAEQDGLQSLRGSNNLEKSDSIGIKLVITFDEEYAEEYSKLLGTPAEIRAIPAEYYRVHWYSFANNGITRSPLGLSHIDATTIRLQSGTDYYLQNIIGNNLDAKERVSLAIAYRKLKENFSSEASIKSINTALTQKKGAITAKALAIAIDVSQKSNWESSLVPHLDDLPFQYAGKGEQSALKVLLALERKAADSHIILVEEPENHLSFASMNILISKIKEKCHGKQIVVVTHSAYVLNKLGIEKLLLLNAGKTASLKSLSTETQDYFKKLSGYDTLRLILAKKAILVEGPSDELIVQKAYLGTHGRLPIEDGVDVINVRGLSFLRFLEIASKLNKTVTVVTDNDGDYEKNILKKYAEYSSFPSIRVCADTDNTHGTLEPQIMKVNTLAVLNKLLGKEYVDDAALLTYMTDNKTEWALKLFEATGGLTFPNYILDAVK